MITMTSSFPPESLRPIIKEVAELLKERKETVSVAETAAGGLISACLLSYPGASAYYRGGLTLYTLQSRVALGGWTESDIKNYNGPTLGIVRGLAEHTRKTFGSTYAVSESGTAGPTPSGETRNRQPGYLVCAVDCENGLNSSMETQGLGEDREANMVKFAEEALTRLRDVIKKFSDYDPNNPRGLLS